MVVVYTGARVDGGRVSGGDVGEGGGGFTVPDLRGIEWSVSAPTQLGSSGEQLSVSRRKSRA